MEVKITSPYGVKLLTAGKRLEEDIAATIDSSLLPSGELTVTENGTYDVYNKETVNVNVPIPDGYVKPSGNLDITENGSYNVTDKKTAVVNVQSGLTINGIIEQYKVQANKTVNAGDFVEFVKAVSWGSGSFDSGNSTNISACKLNDNSVLVAYCDGGNSNYGTAVVLQMAETEIIVGTKVVFNSYTNGSLSACRLTDNSVLVAYTGTSSGYGKARILTINGTTITTGTETTFNSATSLHISAESLNNSTVLVTYRDNGNTRYGTAIILSVNGTTITAGVEKVFLSADLPNATKICKLTDNKALVAFYKSSTLTFAVFSVSGTTISVGATKTVGYSGVSVSVAVLNENKVLVAYSDQVNATSAVLLTIDGATITVGTETQINTSKTTVFSSAVALNENKVLISYDRKIQALTIDGTVITLGQPTTLTSNAYYANLVVLSPNSVVCFYNDSGGYYLGLAIDGTTVTPNTEVKNETLVLPTDTVINGIANTSGTAGETVEVYVPIPKGYTVTLIADYGTNNGQYSIDGGTTWVTIPVGQTTTLSNVETIMFKCASGYGANYHTIIGTSMGSSNIALLADTQTSANITLTADTTYYISEYTTSDGGGSN